MDAGQSSGRKRKNDLHFLIAAFFFYALEGLGGRFSQCIIIKGSRLRTARRIDCMNRERYLRQIDRVIQQGPYKAQWESIASCPLPPWYREKRLGIFLHWGPFSGSGLS